MCTPGQPFFSFFFFQLHSSTIHAECKTRETPTPGRFEGVRGFVGAHHFHLSRSNEGMQHLVSETAWQSNTVQAPEMDKL